MYTYLYVYNKFKTQTEQFPLENPYKILFFGNLYEYTFIFYWTKIYQKLCKYVESYYDLIFWYNILSFVYIKDLALGMIFSSCLSLNINIPSNL